MFGAKIFDFRRATAFCFGHHFSKQNMPEVQQIGGGHGPLPPRATPMAQSMCGEDRHRLSLSTALVALYL